VAETVVAEDPEEALEEDYDATGEHVDTDAPSGPPADADDGVVGDTQEAGVADQFDRPRDDEKNDD
jgi:hypothetical protein